MSSKRKNMDQEPVRRSQRAKAARREKLNERLEYAAGASTTPGPSSTPTSSPPGRSSTVASSASGHSSAVASATPGPSSTATSSAPGGSSTAASATPGPSSTPESFSRRRALPTYEPPPMPVKLRLTGITRTNNLDTGISVTIGSQGQTVRRPMITVQEAAMREEALVTLRANRASIAKDLETAIQDKHPTVQYHEDLCKLNGLDWTLLLNPLCETMGISTTLGWKASAAVEASTQVPIRLYVSDSWHNHQANALRPRFETVDTSELPHADVVTALGLPAQRTLRQDQQSELDADAESNV